MTDKPILFSGQVAFEDGPVSVVEIANNAAASPDLAEALDLALARCIAHGATETHPFVIAARSALAIAKGETT